MHEIQQSLAGLALGAPQVHRNLALFPLLAPEDRPAAYLLLDEALEKKLARVTEVSAGGSVPELAFENGAAEQILLVDGDELVGAKQNRIVNLSILVGAGKRLVIPVSCVEQGRWSYRSREAYRNRDFAGAGRALFAKARAKKMVRVSESLHRSQSRRSDQGEVWNDISDKMAMFCMKSDTMAMSDAYERRDADLGAYARAFRAEPRQRGAVVALDGRVTGLEVFDSAAAFAKYLDKLVRSYALDALETAGPGPVAPPEEAARRFLERIKASATERFAALGEGEDIRLKGDGVAGGALAAEGRVVHLAGYAVA
jgi:hypothetical protein